MLTAMRFAFAACTAALAVGLCACLAPTGPTADDAGGSEDGTGHDDSGEPERPSPALEACRIGGEAPRTIPELVERIDALPHPVTIPCVLASLPRPLSLVATNSVFSVQPAEGDENPRIFILADGLILSVVPTGKGSELLEFSQFIGPTESIKAELEFPIDGPIPADEPYEHEFYEALSRCGVCHRDEYEWPERAGAYVSVALRPVPNTLVPVASLASELDACDWDEQPARCEMLSALLDFGEVAQGSFAEELPTIFD